MNSNISRGLLALTLSAALPALSQAQTAGSWLIQGGLTQVTPQVSSGNLSAPAPGGTQTDVRSDLQPTGQITYFHTDHIAFAVPLGAGFQHDIVGKGAIDGVGVIGTVRALPITAYAQYRLGQPDAQVRPYLSVGASYVSFSDEQGSATLNGINPANPPGGSTQLQVDSKWALNAGAGVTVALAPRWYLDVMVSKTFLKTRTTLSTGQTLDAGLDPVSLSMGLAYRFK